MLKDPFFQYGNLVKQRPRFRRTGSHRYCPSGAAICPALPETDSPCLLSAIFFIIGIVALLPAIKAARLEPAFSYQGTHPLNIRFIHGLFFSTISRPKMQEVFFISSNPIYIFCIVMGCAILLSILILPLQKRLSKMLF